MTTSSFSSLPMFTSLHIPSSLGTALSGNDDAMPIPKLIVHVMLVARGLHGDGG